MNLISNGFVDGRDIRNILPDDVKKSKRVHWFAGIGGWDYALQIAGWPIDRPVWTASLPCQPFSCAGKQIGKSDERHLLPHFLELVNACRPPVIFGEQVPGAIKHGWLDDLCDAMEREGYTVRAAVLTAAGIGAPHIRQRLYWVAYRSGEGLQRHREYGEQQVSSGRERAKRHDSESCAVGGMAYSEDSKHQKNTTKERHFKISQVQFGGSGLFSRMGNTESERLGKTRHPDIGYKKRVDIFGTNIEWIYCRDDKFRPIKSCISPLVDGVPRGMVYSSYSSIAPNETGEARAMRLKGYGNAIVPQVAAEFIGAFL